MVCTTRHHLTKQMRQTLEGYSQNMIGLYEVLERVRLPRARRSSANSPAGLTKMIGVTVEYAPARYYHSGVLSTNISTQSSDFSLALLITEEQSIMRRSLIIVDDFYTEPNEG